MRGNQVDVVSRVLCNIHVVRWASTDLVVDRGVHVPSLIWSVASRADLRCDSSDNNPTGEDDDEDATTIAIAKRVDVFFKQRTSNRSNRNALRECERV